MVVRTVRYFQFSVSASYRQLMPVPGGVVLCGYRHPHIISQLSVMTGERHGTVGKYTDGFLTNKNRFVDRIEGGKLWVSNGNELKFHPTKLFSEDLY